MQSLQENMVKITWVFILALGASLLSFVGRGIDMLIFLGMVAYVTKLGILLLRL